MYKVCILGGTGFVGRHLIANLSKRGIQCNVVARHPQRHTNLQVNPGVQLLKTQSFDVAALKAHFDGCNAVINLVGILNQTNKQNSFRKVHVELVDTIVEAANQAGVQRLLHMSALHASAAHGSSEYLRSKGEGENRAHTHGGSSLRVTSLRPSVIFGSGDSFFNRFATLLKLSPLVFPLACPNSRFAPVWVEDVAEAFARCLEDDNTVNGHYDLCGPDCYSLQELVSYTAKTLGLKRLILPLGDGISKLQARLLGVMPGRPFTMDNYLSLQTDSLCEQNGFEALGIQPQAIDAIVPRYLAQGGYRGRFDRYRRQIKTGS